MGMTPSKEKFSNVAVAGDHVQYDPWIGSLDVSKEEIEWDGIVLGVEKEGVLFNKFFKNSHRFLYPGVSYLRVKLKPPTKFFRYNDALRGSLVSVFYEKGIPKPLALLTLEFLKWYGTKITLRHHATAVNWDSSRCFVDIRLENSRRKEKPSKVLAKKFTPTNGGYVTNEIFVPKEELRRFSDPSIIILYHQESYSHYWFRSLEISLSSDEEAMELPRNFNAIWNN